MWDKSRTLYKMFTFQLKNSFRRFGKIISQKSKSKRDHQTLTRISIILAKSSHSCLSCREYYYSDYTSEEWHQEWHILHCNTTVRASVCSNKQNSRCNDAKLTLCLKSFPLSFTIFSNSVLVFCQFSSIPKITCKRCWLGARNRTRNTLQSIGMIFHGKFIAINEFCPSIEDDEHHESGIFVPITRGFNHRDNKYRCLALGTRSAV